MTTRRTSLQLRLRHSWTKLSFRLGAAILLIETLMLGVGGVLLVGIFTANAEREMLSRVTAPGRLMLQGGLPLSAVADQGIMRALVGDTLLRAMVVGVDGMVLQSLEERHVGRSAAEITGLPLRTFSAAPGGPNVVWGDDGNGEYLAAVSPLPLEPSGTPLFFLYIQNDAQELAAARQQALLNIVAAMVVAAVLSTLIINQLMRRSILGPVRRMSDIVHRIGTGELSVRCPPGLPGELGVLGRGLNVMADAIEANDRTMRELNLELERKYDERTQDLQHELRMRRDTERQLRLARDTAHEALVAKSRFLAAASHDLRQPVHALRLLLSAAEGLGPEDGQEVHGLLAEMKESVGNLSDLLNALLDVSRLEAGVIVPLICDTSLMPLLRDLDLQFQREAVAADVRLHVVSSSRVIRSDPILLKRVLANLLSNAIKFSEGGAVLVGCRRRGHSVDIQVCDTGKGIEAASIDEIFDEFKQLDNEARQKSKGLGLGLTIVRRIAALLDHPVRVESTVGRGTVFTVTVPLAEPSPLPSPSPGPRRVLLVDDDANVLRATEMALRRWGVEPDAHADGDAVLAACAGAAVPDALVVDYRLPGRFNGIEVIEQVRARTSRHLPAILITGEAATPAADGLAGVVVLRKPVRPEDLQAALTDLWR